MYHFVVEIDVADFEAFEAFETVASRIMCQYQGRIKHAFELDRKLDGTGKEVHIVEFPTLEAFHAYKADPRFEDLTQLRQSAITSTQVNQVLIDKRYL